MFSRLDSFIKKITLKNSSVFVFLFCTTLIFYGNVLFGDFIFDDNIFIENNIQIRSLANFGQIYQSNTTAGSGLTGDNFYRPNQQFIYAILYFFFGLSPFFFHLIPILFHVINGFLIFLLFTKLEISRKSAFFGALIFLLHPVLTEAVSYVSGLSEPLVLFTILTTLLIFLKSTEELPIKKFLQTLLLGVIVFSVGLLSKESQSVSLGLITILAILKYKKGELNNLFRSAWFVVLLAAISAVYIYMRVNFLNFTGVLGLTDALNPYTENLWIRVATFIHILPEYFKMIVFPWHLNYEKPYFFVSSFLNTQSFVGILIIISGAILSLISIFRKNGEIFFGLMWFAVAFVPFSGLVPLNAIYLEHWLYIPIIGLIFYVSYLFDQYRVFSKPAVTFILIILLSLFGIRVMMRNVEWGDSVKFYENELKYTQTSARIYNNLAMELSDRGDCHTAVVNYKKAISLNDIYPQTHHNLARCLEYLSKPDQAFNEYLRALEIQPYFSYSLNAINDLIRRYPYLLNSSNRWRFLSP